MHSKIFGIAILNSVKEILENYPSLDNLSYEENILSEFSDYTKPLDEKRSKEEFEFHLEHSYPHYQRTDLDNKRVYIIPIQDIYEVLVNEWKTYKVNNRKLTIKDYLSPDSYKMYKLSFNLVGNPHGVRYGIFNIKGGYYTYPCTLLESLRDLYQMMIDTNKSELIIELLGTLDYHY